MKTLTVISLIIILFSAFLLSSCREDVVAPGNPAGNINQPIRLKSNSSYTFIINAENITASLLDNSGITSRHSELFLSLDDYKQGRVNFNIIEYSNQLVYQKQLSDNLSQMTVSLEGNTPDIINISFSNFTGKLKIQLYIN